MTEQYLAHVRPELAAVVRRVLARAEEQGVRAIVVQGLRTEEEQARLYAQGRTAPGPIVTLAATAEATAHGRGAAVDLAILDSAGRPSWDIWTLPLYEAVGLLAEAAGLEWGGRFTRPDRPHLQLAGWRELPFPFNPQSTQ
jgi:peptidoglycan L-alanyl-D-glutamate endopeptidase CwlK